MILLALAEPSWYGPTTVTFAVQLPGDPFDAKKNDVRIRFLGDRDQREERVAWFDPGNGVWKATLFAPRDGRYRAILIRNGKELSVEPEEGILDLKPAPNLGYLSAKASRKDRLSFDTGTPWVGFGVDLGENPSPERIGALSGANWVRIAPSGDPLDYDSLVRFGAAVDEIERRGLFYTLVVPATSSAAWRRYALARFGASPYLVGWEGKVDDPQGRPNLEPDTWDALFENKPGPFYVREKDAPRFKALHTVVERSGWADWDAPKVWKGTNAKGVAESDRCMLFAAPGAKLIDLPLAEGAYDLTTIDPATGSSTASQVRVEQGALKLPVTAERFFVLRRRL